MGDRISAAEAAKRLGISVRTLWRWCDAGKIDEAPRTGNYRMFYAEDVEAVRSRIRGVTAARSMTTRDVYKRLKDGEDISAIERDLAETICATARGKDRAPLEAAYRAACSMAATHPDVYERARWTEAAQRYGELLGNTDEETEALITKRENSPYVTYETAQAEVQAAPNDPAYAIATWDSRKRSPMSVNSQ